MSRICRSYANIALLAALATVNRLDGQSALMPVSPTAYRALGQPDLRQNALNMAQGLEFNGPAAIALDARGGQTHIYVADTQNSRILAWPDIKSYQIGDQPALILGQPGPQYTVSHGIGSNGLFQPYGLAVDPTTGNLYVADTADNRVVRFPAPFSNPNRVQPDLVYGQASFTTSTTTPVSASLLNQPFGVAVDSAGNLWVSDTGNNRILRFNASSLNNTTPPSADLVIGEPNFTSNGANGGGSTPSAAGLASPMGLTFDSQNNLYVADFQNARVVKFSGPFSPGQASPPPAIVWGEPNLNTIGYTGPPSAATLQGPTGVAVDAAGNVYVATPLDNRILVFPAAGGSATSVYGQSDFVTTTANSSSYPQASPQSLNGPRDVMLDASGNVIIADTVNNRVLEIPAGQKSAIKVWGQSSFTGNGPNQIKPGSIAIAYKMAIDYSAAPYALYVSDLVNNRILVWKDSAHFLTGDPADLVIGQPNLFTGAANIDTQGSATTPSATGLWSPNGIVVASDGTLYVADSGNNRVLRYPRPVNQSGRITPDAVIGQPAGSFNTSISAVVNASTLKAPSGLAIGPNGDLFVADGGNNRVLEFPAGAGNGAVALRVYGQPSFTSSLRPTQVSTQTLADPQGIFVDQGSNLYVADSPANRVMVFPNTTTAPTTGMSATYVIGPASFNTTQSTLKAPLDVATDSSGDIFISDEGNNRVLIYQSLVFLATAGGTPSGVLGQATTGGTTPNWDSLDGLATADGLNSPFGIYVDRQDTLYVGDAGNSRVLQFLKPAVVVNAATFAAGVPVAQGSLASLFGPGLATGAAGATTTTWPTKLLNRQVVVNDQNAAPLYYFSGTQANFQVPSNAPLGTQRIAVRTADTGELVAGGNLQVQATGPGLFTSNSQGSGQGAVQNQDFSVNSAANPAPVGSVVSIYATGQGQVSPAVPDGTPAPSPPSLAQTVAVPTTNPTSCLNSPNSMCVAFGSTFATVTYSGLAPGFVGLWQINVVVPAGVGTGNVNVRVVIDGSTSNIVTVAVK